MKIMIKLALVLTMLASTSAMAHISYKGNFGTFDGTTATGTITSNNSAATGNFGWIDATDTDDGDSHKTVAYRFSLTGTANVSLTFAGTTYTPTTGAAITNAITPGFSVYQGLVHLTGGADYDNSAGSVLLRDTTTTEGSFKALSTWKVSNDADTTGTNPSILTYKGHAYDGATFNGVAGADGTADGSVTKTFTLAAGDYSVFVGGTDNSQNTGFGNPGATTVKYGVSASLAITPVPEPETYLMMMLGLTAVAGRLRQRRFAA